MLQRRHARRQGQRGIGGIMMGGGVEVDGVQSEGQGLFAQGDEDRHGIGAGVLGVDVELQGQGG